MTNNISKRTHYCTDITEAHAGQHVTLYGWAHNTRKLGQLIFIALRDRTGLVQISLNENTTSVAVFETAKTVKNEYVLAIRGTVTLRAEKDINPDMATGKIEVIADELQIINSAETPPFQIGTDGVNEALRLKYRYLDMRRPEMQQNFLVRHKLNRAIREFYNANGFIEIETPTLTKGTPEGAREYMVPSRVSPGDFYVLPQSPQQFKQLLMLGGFDRYFQIARCFRDEDSRGDRQPEFTQLDVEMSFINREDIFDNTERMLATVFKEAIGIDVPLPLMRMGYEEAMARYGSDKPDLRFGMEIHDVTKICSGTEFEVFNAALAESKSSIRGIKVAGQAALPRKQQDALQEYVRTFKAKGLIFISLSENSEVKSSVSKFVNDDKLKEILSAFKAEPNDLVILCAGVNGIVADALGNLRNEMARRLDIISKDEYRFLWITDIPLLEQDEETGKWNAVHHPFTAPMPEDADLFETNPGAMRAQAYDVVLNGYELGGGSIRITNSDMQRRMFKTLGLSEEEIDTRFGHMIEAYKYGAPTHGGIALGVDRIAMLMTGAENIREVIAFPKTKDARCPLTDAPGAADDAYLKELGISVNKINN
ncbi:MAG: aspartate--tRNA ligase [Defluviitaleaceae bacterium]|nr:aspartate--tRNA ligase [Defluviitaleaceae bacterium]